MPLSSYRIEVAPLVILPLDRSPLFSYSSRSPLPLGSLVRIPFGRREIEGVVYACQPLPGKTPPWMKTITGVEEEAFLTDGQRELALFVSSEYFTPLGRVLKHFLPKLPKTRKVPAKKVSRSPVFRPTKDEKALIDRLEKLPASMPGFLDPSVLDENGRAISVLAKAAARGRGQVLILVPEVTLLTALESALGWLFPVGRIATLHSLMAPSAFFSEWERIRSGEASVIVATRIGLFAPFQKLGLVILSEEQDESYKQWDMSPRYHARSVSKELARIFAAKLIYASSTPSTETLLALREKQARRLGKLSQERSVGEGVTLVNLKLERYRKNLSPISEDLKQELDRTLLAGKQALVYVHRQGMSAFSVCAHCKQLFRCPKSDHALVNTPDGAFRCLACGYATPLFPSCPACGHLSFKHIGFGTERLERELHKLFPRARLARADASTMRKAGEAAALYRKGMAREIDILIGTQMILKNPPLPDLSLVAMIDADSLLSGPDFRADERLFHNLSRSVELARRGTGKDGSVVVQTFHPENTFFSRLRALSPEAFADRLLSEREALGYPPFTRLITLTCQDKDEEKLSKRLEAVSEGLREVAKKEPDIRETLLETARYLKRQRLFESSLLIRVPHTYPFSPAFTSFLRAASRSCIIDIDPLSFT